METGRTDRSHEIRERVRANFDRGAGAYAAFEEEREHFRNLVRELLRDAPPLSGARVLDVGCGTGASLRFLGERVGRYGTAVGLDISGGMLKQARQRLGPEAALVLGDACAFAPAFRAVFRAVVYNAVLHIVPNARASLASARELLEPGGVVLASCLDQTCLTERGTPLAEVLRERGFEPGRTAVSPWGTVEGALRELFEDVRVRDVSFEMTGPEAFAFFSLEPMSAGLLPNLPYAERTTALRSLATELEASRRTVTQVWKLASGRKQPLAAEPVR